VKGDVGSKRVNAPPPSLVPLQEAEKIYYTPRQREEDRSHSRWGDHSPSLISSSTAQHNGPAAVDGNNYHLVVQSLTSSQSSGEAQYLELAAVACNNHLITGV
jgi:hypothetical protein